ncbi:predicted protein, partial [Nematostella vectensis]
NYLPSVGYFPSFPSSFSHLPKDLLALFRPVAVTGPDWAIILEVWLLSQGFINGTSIANKITTLKNLCQKMI